MFRKILIANRGEVAVGIIRACRELNVSPVAVYSEVDAAALHVRMADEAYCIGPPQSTESYLSIPRIIDVAEKAEAEAIHPGYGFLAENAAFARAVGEAGLIFIGPPAEAMEIMGSKTSARRAAVEAGAPIVPGSTEALKDVTAERTTAAQFGYPVMLKAAAAKACDRFSKNANCFRPARRRNPRLRRPLETQRYILRKSSTGLVISRFKSSLTRTETMFISVNENVRSNEGIRK